MTIESRATSVHGACAALGMRIKIVCAAPCGPAPLSSGGGGGGGGPFLWCAVLTMAAAVGVSDLLASAFSSTLGSTVVTYDQYQKDKDDEKDEPVYYQALDVDQLFVASNL